MTLPGLVGMIHLGPLPGSPGYGGSLEEVIERAVADSTLLTEVGFPAVMVENLGDAPFFADTVPAVTVAAMTRVVCELKTAGAGVIGVNVLRNDALSAVAIAAATGAGMIRVNVLSGTMYTDQGAIEGRAAEVARLRAIIAPDVVVLADVFVKHAVPPPGLTLEQAALDTWERGGADALVISGTGTGRPVDPSDLVLLSSVVPDAPLVVGSGTTVDTLTHFGELAASVIVGSALKHGGDVHAAVDRRRAAAFADAARRARLLR